MPESTSQPPQNGFIKSEAWNQENNVNIVRNRPILEWSELPIHSISSIAPAISNANYVPSVINGHMPIASPAPNYMNVPYQRNVANVQNGQPIVRFPNIQNSPAMVRPQSAITLPNGWPMQPNINRAIPPGWTKPNGGVKKQKRIRTAFTSHQMMELEKEYTRTRYLDRTRRIELADHLHLNERTIKIWFQNRRMKEKKDRAESLEEMEDVSTTETIPELGIHILRQEGYQGNNEALGRMGVSVEQYPVSSTSMDQLPIPLISYQPYAAPPHCPPQYQDVHLQVQQYDPPHIEVQEVSPQSTRTEQSESSTSVDNSASSDVLDKNWDLSWIRSIQMEEC